MAFIQMEGVEGLVYVPEDDGRAKKHPCDDCYSCQWCSDNRCELCLKAQSSSYSKSCSEFIPLHSIKHR